MTASPGRTYTNDILGNRLSKSGAATYGWDALNRMVSLDTTHEYLYRADGMRVRKTISGSGVSYVDSFYDGQMPIEEHAHWNGLTTSISRNGIGARGIDMVTSIESVQAVDAYPLYDAHGNNVATLTKGSGTTYTVGNRRTYDAWGAVRSGSTAGKAKYVANLGHVEDEESGLIYMRARYYEPSSGRFVSQDPAKRGANWLVYCSNNPLNSFDPDGRDEWSDNMKWVIAAMGAFVGLWIKASFAGPEAIALMTAFTASILLSALHTVVSMTMGTDGMNGLEKNMMFLAGQVMIAGATIGVVRALSPGAKVREFYEVYAGATTLALALLNFEVSLL